MRALVTSTRLPAAVELVRKLGGSGNEVYAADTFRAAPGSHSTHVHRRFKTPQPRAEPARYVDAIVELVREHRIDVLMPVFEEVFYLAKHRERLEPFTELFFPSFETLRRLHHKAAFLELARDCGLQTGPFEIATTAEELARATARLPRYFARAAYSRGGVALLTNEGPLADEVALAECEPTPQNPFVVQPFIDGRDVCAYGVAQHGRLVAFAAYVHPFTMEHAGGIVFESVVNDAALDGMRRVVEATGYHGQISLDFMENEDGLTVIECNPRPTAGLTVMPDAMFDEALRDAGGGETLVAPPGTRRQLSLGLIRNMLVHPEQIPASLQELMSGDPDVYATPGDMLPLLYQVVAYGHVIGYRFRKRRMGRRDIMQGYFYDITWDGQDIQ